MKGLQTAFFSNLLGLSSLPDNWEKVEEIENHMEASGVLDIQELDGGDVFLLHNKQKCRIHFKTISYEEVVISSTLEGLTATDFYQQYYYSCVQHSVEKLPITVNKRISYLEENEVGDRYVACRYEATSNLHLRVQVAKLIDTPTWAMWMPTGIHISDIAGVTTPKMKEWLSVSGKIGTSSHFHSYWEFKIPVGKEMEEFLPLPLDFPNHPPRLGHPTPNETVNKDWEQWLLSIGRQPYKCPCRHCWERRQRGGSDPCIIWS